MDNESDKKLDSNNIEINNAYENSNDEEYKRKGHTYFEETLGLVKKEDAESEGGRNTDTYNKTEEFSEKRKAERYEEHIKDKTLPKKKKKEGMSWKKAVLMAVIIGVLGGVFSGIGYGLATKTSAKEAMSVVENKVSKSENTIENANRPESYFLAKDIIKNVSPAVVNINVEASGVTTYWGMYEVPYKYKGAGSGVIFSEDDSRVYIITNSHVIENSTDIFITLDEAENIPAALIGNDSAAELAVLSITKEELSEKGVTSVTVAKLGNSDELEVGDSVIAIGNSLGLGKVSTGGMISAIGKQVNIEGKSLEVIQTDAAINEGNSGGALVNYKGEVIGINTAKTSNASAATTIEGMGYAIPINTAKPIIENLLIEGTMEKPYLGIVGRSVTDELAEIYGLPVGVYIVQVMEGGAAYEGGIKEGDIIIDFNGKKVYDMDVLIEEIGNTEVGDEVDLKVIREGKSVELKVIIADANAR